MRRQVRTALDVTVGAAVSGVEWVYDETQRMAERGKTSRHYAQARLAEEITSWGTTGREKTEDLRNWIKTEVDWVMHRMRLATREELEALQRRIAHMEARLTELERHRNLNLPNPREENSESQGSRPT